MLSQGSGQTFTLCAYPNLCKSCSVCQVDNLHALLQGDARHCCQQPLLSCNIKLGQALIRLHHGLLAVADDVVRLQQYAVLAQVDMSSALCFEAWWPDKALLHPYQVRVPILKLCNHSSCQQHAYGSAQHSTEDLPADPNTACCTAASNAAVFKTATPVLHAGSCHQLESYSCTGAHQ